MLPVPSWLPQRPQGKKAIPVHPHMRDAHITSSSLWRLAKMVPPEQGSYLRTAASTAFILALRLQGWRSKENAIDTHTTHNYLLDMLTNRERATQMAPKKAAIQNTDQVERIQWVGFLERSLTDEELASADNWDVTAVDIMQLMQIMIEDDYRVSASYSLKTKMATAAATDNNPNRKSAGRTLSARGSDCLEAIKLLQYKHHFLLDRDWTPLLKGDKPTLRRG